MRNTWQIIWGIILILVASGLLFAIISLSQAEGIIRLPNATSLPSSTSTSIPTPSQAATLTPVIYTCPTTVQVTCPSYIPATLPPTPPPTPTSPAVTTTVTVSPTVTFIIIPTITPTTTAIPTTSRVPTQTLPPTAYAASSPTHAALECGAPHSWVIYVVRKGDTLYHLGQIYGVPYTEIQRANCLVNNKIRIGQLLYVPPWTPIMASPTFCFEYCEPTEIATFYLPFETPATGTPVTDPSFPPDNSTPTDTVPTP